MVLNHSLFRLYLVFRQNFLELDTHVLENGDINFSNPQQANAAFFDITTVIYLHNFSKSNVLNYLRKIDAVLQKQKVPVFLFLRNSLLCNEYLYLIHKAVIISNTESNISSEERFAEPSDLFAVSILSKPGSGKLEIDDRFEFCVSNGFILKKIAPIILSSSASNPLSTFNINHKNTGNISNDTEARILVEDSDRDSEDEMEADSNF